MALERLSLPTGLLKHMQQHQAMQQAIHASLSNELAAHVTYINLRGGTLILGCDQQSLLTTLRFCAPQILAAVNALLPTPSALRVAWRTLNTHSPERNRRVQRQVSALSAQHIATAAHTIEDAALRAAMQRLAQTMRAKPKPIKRSAFPHS